VNKYSTIFFDWSGVIADDSGDEFIDQLFRSVGATDNQIKEIIGTHFVDFLSGTVSETEFWNNLKINYRLNITEPTSKKFEKWRGLVANKDILELAGEAKARGFRIAVLTNIVEPVYDIIKRNGYYGLFDGVISSCKVGLVKPQKEIYELALKRFNTTAQQSIFIDDKQSNLETAARMGFKTILAESPDRIIREVRELI